MLTFHGYALVFMRLNLYLVAAGPCGRKIRIMKKLLLCICFLPMLVSAQNIYFGARLGLAGYHGDLKPMSKPFSQMKFLKSFGLQYDLTEHIAARTYFTWTK